MRLDGCAYERRRHASGRGNVLLILVAAWLAIGCRLTLDPAVDTSPTRLASRGPSLSPVGTVETTPQPTPSPTVDTTPQPTPSPTVDPTGPAAAVPDSIDATGSVDVSANLQTFLGAVPDGSTIVFPGHAVYRIDNGLRLDDRHNLIFEGNGATLKASGCDGTDSPFVIGWDRASSEITIRNFTLLGDNADGGTKAAYHSSCESQIGVLIHQSNHVEISGVTISNVYGDCINVGDNVNTLLWSEDIWFHDSTCKLIGRQGIQIAAGRRIMVNNVIFDTIARRVLNFEPKKVSGGGVDLIFRNNTVGSCAVSSTVKGGACFAGISGHTAGVAIHNVTISGNLITGESVGSRFRLSGVTNIVFTDNVSTVAAPGPILVFEHVTNVTVTGNVQPLTSGEFAVFLDSTGVVYTP